MMNLDGARAGEGILSPKKDNPDPEKIQPNPSGPTEPVFSSEERNLNIEIPTGWSVKR